MLILVLCGAPPSVRADNVARAGAPLRLTVAIPATASDSAVVMVELAIAVTPNTPAAHPGVLVRFGRPGGPLIEAGRLSVAPSVQPREGRYQIDVRALVRRFALAGGTAEVEIALIDRSGRAPPAEAALHVGGIRIVTR